jgi:hypothetical protein
VMMGHRTIREAETNARRLIRVRLMLDIDGSLIAGKLASESKGDLPVQATGVALKRTIKAKLVLNLQDMGSCKKTEGVIGGGYG